MPAECKLLYDDRDYLAARNCFGRILRLDPNNPIAREYYRLANVLALGVAASEDSSHFPGTPEVAAVERLVEEALENNPDVRRTRLLLQTAQVRKLDEPLLLSFEAAVMFGIPVYPPWQWAAAPRGNPSSTIEHQKELAAIELDWWQAAWEIVNSEVAAQVRKSFFKLVGLRQEFRVHDAHRQTLTEHKRLILSRYRQGEVPQSQVLEVQRDETQDIEDLIQLEKREVLERAQLNSLLKREVAAPVQLPEALAIPEFTWDSRQLGSLALEHRSELRAAQARVRYLSLCQKSEASTGHWDRLILAEREEVESVKNRIQRELAEAFANAESAFRTLKFYETSLTPQLETAQLSARASYRGGGGEYGAVLESQHRVIANRIRVIQMQREYRTSLAELQRVVGAPLPQASSSKETPSKGASESK